MLYLCAYYFLSRPLLLRLLHSNRVLRRPSEQSLTMARPLRRNDTRPWPLLAPSPLLRAMSLSDPSPFRLPHKMSLMYRRRMLPLPVVQIRPNPIQSQPSHQTRLDRIATVIPQRYIRKSSRNPLENSSYRSNK
ncbi:hypothetical protein FOPG_19282 [Fusarium oxysporum f. sp. conglutinans race 2 54008]|uniref:Uncharacterized protein n=2 Tax=Fusarium oxysporum TaxID=5507 RepID=X0GX26_FUSOX|nr:hypothetical protein FOVG_17891 [Fusarium oxysporum f. sp. pisi HDV247]EXL64455.1 hypothetical protein FOPG_19282 [Fusarium oxysporum f. sp. conglutinans race 2 54008]KAI8411201.1 hypothetical protein FOFC_07795 [Fusarium oxysporum]